MARLKSMVQALLDCRPWMIVALRPDMTIEFCSEAYAELFQCDPEALAGSNLLQLFPPFAQTKSYAAYQQVLVTGKTTTAEGWMGPRYMSAHVHAAPWGLIAFAQDMTEHRRALEAAAAGPRNHAAVLEEERHHLVLEATRDVIWEWDVAQNRVRHAGPLRELLAAPPEGDEPSFSEINRRTHPEDRERVEKALRDHMDRAMPYCERFRVLRFNGKWAWVESRGRLLRDERGTPWRIIGSIHDVTEQVALQEQLMHAQKLESVGRLAGGIAHDFNNVLTGIMGFVEMALDRGALDEQTAEYLVRVRDGAERAALLTRQLLGFARRQATQPQVLSVNELVRSVEKLARLGSNIEVHNRLADDLWQTLMDPVQYEQVLLNLLVNARDAMPNGGVLTIETENHVRAASDDPEFVPGEYVLTRVTDTGEGMSEHVLANAFEPFFTTKEQGKGTGLGLATCWGIAKQNHGHLQARSRRGHGATFEFFLPRAHNAAEAAPLPSKGEKPPSGHERVLLVEDEPMVRQIVAAQLESLGYEAAVAGAPGEALAQAAQSHFDLLLTDMVMPQMSGLELARKLRQERPHLAVLIMSGYSEQAIGADANVSFLAKPFTVVELAQKLRAALTPAKP